MQYRSHYTQVFQFIARQPIQHHILLWSGIGYLVIAIESIRDWRAYYFGVDGQIVFGLWLSFILLILIMGLIDSATDSNLWVPTTAFLFAVFLCVYRPVAFFSFMLINDRNWYKYVLTGVVVAIFTYLLIQAIALWTGKTTEWKKWKQSIHVGPYLVSITFATIGLCLADASLVGAWVLDQDQVPWYLHPMLSTPTGIFVLIKTPELLVSNLLLVAGILLFTGISAGTDKYTYRMLLGALGGMVSAYLLISFYGPYSGGVTFSKFAWWLGGVFDGRSFFAVPVELKEEARITLGAILGVSVAIGTMVLHEPPSRRPNGNENQVDHRSLAQRMEIRLVSQTLDFLFRKLDSAALYFMGLAIGLLFVVAFDHAPPAETAFATAAMVAAFYSGVTRGRLQYIIDRNGDVAASAEHNPRDEATRLTFTPPHLGWLLFSFSGRISRSQYWLAIIAWWLLFSVFIVSPHEDVTLFFSLVLEVVRSFALIASFWSLAAVSIKRFHDRGKSGRWLLILLVPIIGAFWGIIELGFLPSQKMSDRTRRRIEAE